MAKYYTTDTAHPLNLMMFDEAGSFYFRRWGRWNLWDYLYRKVINGDADLVSEEDARAIMNLLDERDGMNPTEFYVG